MRNLAISALKQANFPNSFLSAIAVDTEKNILYIASESPCENESVDVGILKLEGDSIEDSSGSLTSFPISAIIASCQIISFNFLNDSQSLCLLTCAGEIGLLSTEEGSDAKFEVVGSIENGIKCAEWGPDESLLVVITGDDKLLVMTNTLDVVLETMLHVSGTGEDQPVNVGWGSKQTQFHGSLGKTAAQAPSLSLDAIGCSPDDDEKIRVSWRGDGSFFVVSSIQHSGALRRRVLRVYDRQGVLQTTSEPVAGLEHVLSWRPSGNLIASTQRFGFEGGAAGKEGRHDVAFFERNGLRHGGFTLREPWNQGITLRWGYRIRELLWNSDSSVLAVWVEREEGDLIQLWTTGNYHWYLKQEILARGIDAKSRKFTALFWHPEISLKLHVLSATSILQYDFSWETYVSRAPPPNDAGLVAVVDGLQLLVTPFRIENVPPPMASLSLPLSSSESSPANLYSNRTPIHVSFDVVDNSLCVLYHSGQFELWDLHPRLEAQRGKALVPSKSWSASLHETPGHDSKCKQITAFSVSGLRHIACLIKSEHADSVVILNNEDHKTGTSITLPSEGRIVYSSTNLYWQASDGSIHLVNTEENSVDLMSTFPEFCFTAEHLKVDLLEDLFIGLSNSGKLYIASPASNQSRCLAKNCNSFSVASGFLIFMTTSHESLYASLPALCDLLLSSEEAEIVDTARWERRRVERGSRIVTAVPSSMSLVLQMPRGNLETINPRPLVLDLVRKDINGCKFRKAFLACRKHRIDFSTFIERNPSHLMDNLKAFIDQIDEVDYLNLFLTGIGQSSQEASLVSKYCDAIRRELESRDLKKYINSILTACIVRKPPQYDEALSVLHKLKGEDSEAVEEAVKYIIFLVDAETLFNEALGMYDFQLVLMIAQHAQKDPREYLPFLRELRALEKFYQRFKIDDHLKRYSSAMKNLQSAGPSYFDEALSYVEKHNLYTEALSLWKDNDANYKAVLNIYGDWLFERREFQRSALVYISAQKPHKAMVAHERALAWRELFATALEEKISDEDIVETAYRVAEELSSRKRFLEASQVLIDYAKNLRQCVSTLAQGNLFSEARRMIAMHSDPELIESILHPAALDLCTQYSEEISEMTSQLQKQSARIRELRSIKEEEPDTFYGVEEDPTLHNVDVMTEISMAGTAFTRYTAAPSNMSKTSKRSSRSKRKLERKVGSGRKGTVDEEEYLLKSVSKLATRFEGFVAEVESLLPHLAQFTPEHRAEGSDLHDQLVKFRHDLRDAVDDIWAKKEKAVSGASNGENTEASVQADSWAARMEQKIRDRQEAVNRIEQPLVGEMKWDVQLLTL